MHKLIITQLETIIWIWFREPRAKLIFSLRAWLCPNNDNIGGVSGTGNGMQTGQTMSASSAYQMPPPTSGGINEPQECPYCRRTFSCYYSLKRHFQDKHEPSDKLYVCGFCNRTYRTKNSLTTHKSLQHRGSSSMLKRLLKTSAMKNVLGTIQHSQLQ